MKTVSKMSVLLFLCFAIPINATRIEPIRLIGITALVGVSVGALSLSCLSFQSFFGATFGDGRTYNDGYLDDMVVPQQRRDVPAQEPSKLRSFLSMLYQGALLGVGVIVAAVLYHITRSFDMSVTTKAPSPLMVGPVEDVDLSQYVKMPQDITESFDDLSSLPHELQMILARVQKGEAPPQGMLFFGEPGVGKSHSSKALAKECNAILFRIPGHEFTGHGVDFSRRLFTLIDRVKKDYTNQEKEKPIFLVIDEAEVFGIRSKLGFSAIQLDLGGAVRALMDYTEQKENGVTCILTTNHPELIDGALKRPGRVGEHIEFKSPDTKERRSIVKLHAAKQNVAFTSEGLNAIVALSENWTGDYLAQCVARCKNASSNKRIPARVAKQAAIDVGTQWSANQEKREKVRSPWKSFVKSSLAAAGALATGVPAPVFSSGADAVDSLFEG